MSGLSDTKNILHYYFQSPQSFEQGVYNPQELLLIGFLLTLHDSPARAGDALWGLVNPKILDFIPKSQVQEFLYKLVYYAIDVPLHYQLKT